MVLTWPQYKNSKVLISRPAYLAANDGCDLHSVRLDASSESKQNDVVARITHGRDWLQKFLSHVQQIREMKQHHIHLPNEKGERVPLTHCRRPDDPTKCKGDFPRTSWLISEAVVLCRGLLNRLYLKKTQWLRATRVPAPSAALQELP